MQRLGEALGLGIVLPPAALVPLVDVGLGEDNVCRKVFPAGQSPNETGEPDRRPPR
jgi:hypothetical protein